MNVDLSGFVCQFFFRHLNRLHVSSVSGPVCREGLEIEGSAAC